MFTRVLVFIVVILSFGMFYRQSTIKEKGQEFLLGKHERLTLDAALDIARTHEATRMELEELANAGNVSVNYARQQLRLDTKVRFLQCRKCGLNPMEEDYPAKGTKCKIWGKLNHWKRVCKSKPKPQQPRERYRSNTNKHRGTNRRKRSVNELSNDQDPAKQNDQQETDTEVNVMHVDHNQSQTRDRDEILAKVEIQVPNESRRCTIKQATNEDQEIAALGEIINGWPEKQRSLRQGWSYLDDLTVEEGDVIMKEERLLITKQSRKDILAKQYDTDQGIVLCQLRGKWTVFGQKSTRTLS
ncbi:hypothetical protein HOLleu_40782 [Holothuria leucospilota]|uniref:Uncharacterized protein n=1 Tax=Holothuria leucospilota TaxID=206669 RepID=A0A9Q0YE41_HOLLE|nr:hypothetical protein HOLleu_40782 [Holothuria leucospilota]